MHSCAAFHFLLGPFLCVYRYVKVTFFIFCSGNSFWNSNYKITHKERYHDVLGENKPSLKGGAVFCIWKGWWVGVVATSGVFVCVSCSYFGFHCCRVILTKRSRGPIWTSAQDPGNSFLDSSHLQRYRQCTKCIWNLQLLYKKNNNKKKNRWTCTIL